MVPVYPTSDVAPTSVFSRYWSTTLDTDAMSTPVA